MFAAAFNCCSAASKVLGKPVLGVGWQCQGWGTGQQLLSYLWGRIFTFTGLQFKLHPGLNIYLFKQLLKQFPTYHIYNQVLHHVGTRGVNSKLSTHPSIKLDVIFKDVDHPSS